MLELTVLGDEMYDEAAEEFNTPVLAVLHLEHSLVSLSKWEETFEKPFLAKTAKSSEETLSYIKFMTLDPEIPPEVFLKLSEQNFSDIQTYIEKKATATWFSDIVGGSKSSEIITSELIYYWLVTFTIPFEVQTWHLNKLLALVKVCAAKNSKPKKMSAAEIAKRNRDLNAQRKAKLNTSG